MQKKTKLLIIAISCLGLLTTIFGVWFVGRYIYSSQEYGLSDSYKTSVGFVSENMGISPSYEESRSQDLNDDTTEDKVIKSGSVSVEVKNISESVSSVKNLVVSHDGKILSETDSGEGKDRSVNMTVRVEDSKYAQVYEELKNLDGKLIYANSSEQDVTDEYIDLNSRLKNLKSTESQLVKIMSTAETVEDTLAVYSQLSSIRGQIEVLEGSIKYLENRTDFSTISLKITQSSTGINWEEDVWEPLGVLKEAVSALVSFSKGLVNVLIWVVVFSPVVLIPVGVFVVFKKKSKR